MLHWNGYNMAPWAASLIVFSATILPYAAAHERKNQYERDVTSSAVLSTGTQSSATPTSTHVAKGEELTEPLNVTIKGPIYPPTIVVEGLNETT